MKYLICFFVLIVFGCAFFWWQRQKTHIQVAFLKKFLFQKYDLKNTNTFFSLFADEIFEMVALAVLRAPFKLKGHIFKSLKAGDEKPLLKYLQKNETPIFSLLTSLLHAKPHSKPKKLASASDLSKLAELLCLESEFEYDLKKNLPKKFCFLYTGKPLRCLKKLCDARRLFLKTDLKKASEILVKLAKIYQKDNNAYKTAYVYFMLGQIYRLAKAYDAAHLMFEKAFTIYDQTHHLFGKNLVLAALAFNCLPQQNFDDAQAYFKEASRFFSRHPNPLFQAKILNGQCCCHLGVNDFNKALKTANKAYLLHKNGAHKSGMAFSLHLKDAARAGLAQNKDKTSKNTYKQ